MAPKFVYHLAQQSFNIMKNLVIAIVCLLTVSCSKSTETPDPCLTLTDCTETCEFVLQQQTVTTIFLSCFNRWGAIYQGPLDGNIGLIIDDMPEKYQQDSLTLNLCGYARTNEIPLEFPDPSFGEVYQFEAVYMEVKD